MDVDCVPLDGRACVEERLEVVYKDRQRTAEQRGPISAETL
jgi:hypothetical protein